MATSIDKYFNVSGLGSTFSREILAGVATYLSLSYIFIVNPAILSRAGMDVSAILFATAVASGIATLAMGLWARLPFAVAPGLEMNGYFALVAVSALHLSWQQALGATLLSGFACFLIAASPVFPAILASIPNGLKSNIGVSVGVFVATTGLYLTKIVTFSPNGYPDFSHWVPSVLGSPRAFVLYLGVTMSILLSLKILRFPAPLLMAIVIATIGARGLGISAVAPAGLSKAMFSEVAKPDVISGLLDPHFWQVAVVLTIITFFGAMGKSIGLTAATNLQEQGLVKGVDKAVMTNGLGSVLGAASGTSSLIIYVESAVGIASGGRTGIVAIVAGLLMLASLPFTFVVGAVPVEATAGVLLFVGYLLLPIRQWRLAPESFGVFDALVALAMGLLSFVTFGLDKAMTLGFAAYSARNLILKSEKNNYILLAFTLVLLGSVFLQVILAAR